METDEGRDDYNGPEYRRPGTIGLSELRDGLENLAQIEAFWKLSTTLHFVDRCVR
jgi:hypothetical protein